MNIVQKTKGDIKSVRYICKKRGDKLSTFSFLEEIIKKIYSISNIKFPLTSSIDINLFESSHNSLSDGRFVKTFG
jgi:hypothetical protein